MGAAVGAALKKVALIILSDKDNLKTMGMMVLTILVAMILPTMAVLGIFSGTLELDTDTLRQEIVANLSAEDMTMLLSVEDTMTQLDNALMEAELSGRVTEAQALYIMALFEYSRQPDFVSRLAACFWDGQSDAQLIAAVNAEFGTTIASAEFSDVMRSIRSTAINAGGFSNPANKNNLDLVQWAIQAEEAGWGYVWGTFGQVLTRELFEAKLAQYPDAIGGHADFIRSNWVGGRTADCVGLIKGYSWYNPETGSVGYAINGMPDVDANQMFYNAAEKGPISTIPEILGLLVWMEGHIGIYIGDGHVVEAMGTRYGVVRTELAGRGWTNWCKNPYINYIEETEPTEESAVPTE